MAHIPDRFVLADNEVTDEEIEALPPKLRDRYLKGTLDIAAVRNNTPWRDRPRWQRYLWWLALPISITLALASVVVGLLLMFTVILVPFGFFIGLAGTMPLTLQVLWRVAINVREDI